MTEAKEVTRYGLDHHTIIPTEDGKYTLYTDCAALRQEVKTLNRYVKGLERELDRQELAIIHIDVSRGIRIAAELSTHKTVVELEKAEGERDRAVRAIEAMVGEPNTGKIFRIGRSLLNELSKPSTETKWQCPGCPRTQARTEQRDKENDYDCICGYESCRDIEGRGAKLNAEPTLKDGEIPTTKHYTATQVLKDREAAKTRVCPTHVDSRLCSREPERCKVNDR